MLNTSEFNFDKKTRTLSAEASELSSMPALGASFPVKSEHTNRVMYFKYSKTLYDASNEDMTGWEFVPEINVINVNKMIIWND